MKLTLHKPDTFGALASFLCFLHCVFTPILFITHASLCCSTNTPNWWKTIDYAFLAISFIAIYYATAKSSNSAIKKLLWFSWNLLLLSIVNEKYNWVAVNEYVNYIPALLLVGLHVYNSRYCQCQTNKCCSNHECA